MRNTLFLIASAALAGLASSPVQAQWSNYGYDDDDLIRCESRDGRIERCATYGGDVQLVRQLSSNPCVRGRSWGTDSRGVWVSSGCRAEFRVDQGYGYDNGYGNNGGYGDNYGYGNNYGYGDNYGYGNSYGNSSGYGGYGNSDGLFRCESRDGRTQRCNSYGGRVQFIRQLSNNPCVRGQSWGNDSRGVWVSGGCRALFRADDRYGNGFGGNYGNYGNYGYSNGRYGNGLVRCESRDNRSHSCALSAGRNGSIRLLRQLSDKPCIENQTWGRSRNGVWVTRGCRAEFVEGRGGGNGGYQRPPGDLGGGKRSGGYQADTVEDTSGGRPPGDLGGAAIPTNERPPAEVVVERPRSTDMARRTRIRPVEEAPGRVEARPAEEAPSRIQTRPVEEAPGRLEVQTVEDVPGQVQRRVNGGTAEVEVDAPQPASRERAVERGERPR